MHELRDAIARELRRLPQEPAGPDAFDVAAACHENGLAVTPHQVRIELNRMELDGLVGHERELCGTRRWHMAP
jgi:hypothetical protein